MKNLLFTIILMSIGFTSNSQSFNGVAISGDIKVAVDSFKKKGFKYVDTSENVVIMKGEITGKKFELYIISTPKTKQVFKVSGYFEESDNWYALEADYNSIVNILTEKYGKPDNKYASFYKPYYKGDGYELQGLGLGKVSYSAYWFGKDNMNIAVSISKFKAVHLGYENATLVEINTKEKAEIANKVF